MWPSMPHSTLKGQTGYFTKQIFDPSWSFRQTGRKLLAPLLTLTQETEQASDTNPEAKALQGTLKREGIEEPLSFILPDLHMVCSPGTMKLLHQGKPIIAKGKELSLVFHHVHTLVTKRREVEYWNKGQSAKVRVAIVIPEDFEATLDSISDKSLKERLKSFFGGLRVINLHGDLSPTSMDLSELTRGNLFRAHDDEKPSNVRFTLQAGDQQ